MVSKPVALLTPEERAKRDAFNAERRAKRSQRDRDRAKELRAARLAGPNALEYITAERLRSARKRKVKPEIYRRIWNAYDLRVKLRKNKAPAQDLYSTLNKMCAADYNRDDILAESFIFVMEGMTPKDAVAKARKKANKFNNELRFNTIDITDESKSFWIGEDADFGDMAE